jgi:polyhydroxybutyrate depolymerase
VGVDASAGGGSVIDRPASDALWRECNGVSEAPALVQLPDNDPEDGATVTSLRFRVASPTVEAFHVVGGGHTEPSFQARYRLWLMPIVGPQHGDTEMAEEAGSFFSSQGRAAL